MLSVSRFLQGLAANVAISITPVLAEAFELVYETHSAQFFAQPNDITLSPDRRYLYIADNRNDRIALLGLLSMLLLGSFTKGEVSKPHDVVLFFKDWPECYLDCYAASNSNGLVCNNNF